MPIGRSNGKRVPNRPFAVEVDQKRPWELKKSAFQRVLAGPGCCTGPGRKLQTFGFSGVPLQSDGGETPGSSQYLSSVRPGLIKRRFHR
jgi:hypothetical protein